MSLRAGIWAAVSTRRQTDDDKFSLPKQEEDGTDLIRRETWTLTDIMRVPGHSRSTHTEFHKLANAANKKGIDAFLKLQEHWEQRDLDVLIIRDGDRLARTQGVMGTIVENLILANIRIYSFTDGWVDEHNFRMWIAMVGYRAASDVDKLRKFINEGANKRAKRGLPVGSASLWSHKVVRGENGRALYQIPDPDKTLFFQDAAQLILEGVSWYTLEDELFKRFGHANSDGNPWPPRKVYNILYNPSAWGNEARFFRDFRRKSQFKGAWAFDPSEEPPKGVLTFYNVHKPIYEGDLALEIQQEMRRREATMRGSARMDQAYRFTGLLVCGECSCNILAQHQHKLPGQPLRYYCYTKYRTLSYATCTQSKGMSDAYVFSVISAKLDEAVTTRDLDVLLGMKTAPIASLIDSLTNDIKTMEKRLSRMVDKQFLADDEAADTYDTKIDRASKELTTLRKRLKAERDKQNYSETRRIQQKTLNEIADMTTEKFWQLPDNAINQKLHAVMGNRRWLALNGKIYDQIDAPPHRRH